LNENVKAHLARRAVAQDLGELEVGVPNDPMVVVVQGLPDQNRN
jgi:hypothetical protein